jgi:hypothetical protein
MCEYSSSSSSDSNSNHVVITTAVVMVMVVTFIIIIIIVVVVSFMQGIYTHIPETNHVPTGYIVAAIRSLLFLLPLYLVPALTLLFFLH